MNLMVLIGFVLVAAALFGGHLLEGGVISQLLNVPAAIIVFGGTVGAAFIQTGSKDSKRTLILMARALGGREPDFRTTLSQLMDWSSRVRSKGLLELEKDVDLQHDGFVRTGLQLLIDGKESSDIRLTLHTELVAREQRDLRSVKMLDSMGGYAPTMGILGAVLGLIQVMSNLSDPQVLGAGIAMAFVATVYGVAFANLLLIPISNRIKTSILTRYNYQEMVLEGVAAIAQGQNPYVIEQRLMGYLK